MIQQALSGVITLMLAKFILNDVPHMLSRSPSTRYAMGDVVEIWGTYWTGSERKPFLRGTGTVKEIRGGGHFADYTQRRTYIVQLPDRVRMCFASELKLVRRGSA